MPGPAHDSASQEALSTRLAVALEAAFEAATLTQYYFRRQTLPTEEKPDGSPVTIADREAEQQIRRTIQSRFPADAILGEEFGETPGTSGFRWILDPIDGTKSFVRGVPLYGMLLAVEHRGQSVLGIIHMPALGETVYATRGSGAWHRTSNNHGDPHDRHQPHLQPARVSTAASVASALLCTTSFSYTARHHNAEFHQLASACRSIRGWSDCYAHLLVATGRAEAAIEPLIHIWDVAPMIPIMREAGGRYTDWTGRETHLSPTGLSSNGRVHDSILNILRISSAGVD
jgi:histidinol-phosphatase